MDTIVLVLALLALGGVSEVAWGKYFGDLETRRDVVKCFFSGVGYAVVIILGFLAIQSMAEGLGWV